MSMVVLVGVVVDMVLPIREPNVGGIPFEHQGQFVKDGCGIRLIIMHYLCVKRYLLRRTWYIHLNFVVIPKSNTHIWKTRQYQFCFGLSLYAINQRKLYIVGINKEKYESKTSSKDSL